MEKETLPGINPQGVQGYALHLTDDTQFYVITLRGMDILEARIADRPVLWSHPAGHLQHPRGDLDRIEGFMLLYHPNFPVREGHRFLWAINIMNLQPYQPHDESIFVAKNATVFGEVRLGTDASVWFGAVIRGDVEHIWVGEQTNIQDLCMLHADPGFPCEIGDRVTVGHSAIVHGATVENDVLIGMRAVILNGAVVGTGSVVAAGCVITEGTVIPPNSLVMGMPGKVRGATSGVHTQMIARGAKHYCEAAKEYLKSLDN